MKINPITFFKASTVIVFSLIILSCNQQALITNKQRQDDINRMLQVQQALTKNSRTDIWSIFSRLSGNEKQAMEFLYAYMPLSDLADYTPEFFLGNVQQSLQARKETLWGTNIPEDVFLHFVLPVRVNNENLDSFRLVMYPEIMKRIKGLSMKDAALEINHWCHEKVNYRGTDGRTSAPLSTISKTFGRCGEESTFTVAAMRTAGIPARQVYTPRWAHSDDNHAWVEVWIDGKWFYLGACEPEPVLNKGWFDEPSRRTMLVHTRAYGRYFGGEEVVYSGDRFSELNLTANYATVKDIFVKVLLPGGAPADSAKVEFKLYNYAEFYPIATGYTGKSGIARLKTGMGDLLIWASKNGNFAWQKFSVPETDTLILTLNANPVAGFVENLDMVPPHAVKVDNSVTEEQKAVNDKRLADEDSIRNAYMATFRDSAWAVNLAAKLNLPSDSVRRLIAKSYGNWQDISRYLEKNSGKNRNYVLKLASQISDKDLSDTREQVLTGHLEAALAQPRLSGVPEDVFIQYVLAPRISLELLTPWRSFLVKEFGKDFALQAQKDISVLTTWIRDHITIDNKANLHSRAPLSPAGVYNLQVANSSSRDIFFVAACRSFGIPARLNPSTFVPEYWNQGNWLLAGFDVLPPVQPVKGKLRLTPGKNPVEPQYYFHFTIGRIKDGICQTLEFDEGRRVSEFGEVMLDTGKYVLITGNRMEDGSVLSSMTFFRIQPNKTSPVLVELRKMPANLKPSGKLDFGAIYITSGSKEMSLATLTGSRNAVVMLIDPDKEPSKHILNDLGPYVDHFDKWDGVFIIAMPNEKSGQAGVLKTYSLPSKMHSGVDTGDNLLKALTGIYGDGLKEKLPLVMVCDHSGNIYLFSAGYKIGIGEQILRITPSLAAIRASCQKL